MANEPVPSEATAAPEPKKHSVAARLLAALAFSTVGAKISWGGMVFDANAILGKEMTFGEKFKGVFNGTLFKKMSEQVPEIMAKENKSMMGAYSKLFKYTMITTVVGTTAGAVLGWVRGGEIEDWKDIIHHPIRSTKIILGMEKAPGHKAPTAQMAEAKFEAEIKEITTAATTPEKEAPAPKKSWVSSHKASSSHVDSAVRPDTGAGAQLG